MRWSFLSIDAPGDRADLARRFWRDVTGWTVSEPWDEHPEFRTFQP